MIDDEIKPTLEKLESEQKDYVQWSNAQREIEELTHLITAAEYFEAQKMLDSSAAEVSEMEMNKARHEETLKECDEKLVGLVAKLEKMKQEQEKVSFRIYWNQTQKTFFFFFWDDRKWQTS